MVKIVKYKRFVQKVSGLTIVHKVDKAYGVLTQIVFNIVPFRNYTLRPTFLPLLETFCKLCSWSGRPARPRTQHDYHHDTKAKPEAATAVIELLIMGGKTPETC